jgi:hypothetical protein
MRDTFSSITPPRLKDGLKPLQQIAVTTSSQVVAIDAQVRNRYVRIRCTSNFSFYLRSDNSGSVDASLATSVGSSEATLGYRMLAGIAEDFELGGQDNYIVVDGEAAGVLQILGCGRQATSGKSTSGP